MNHIVVIQILRAAAALMVVFVHAKDDAALVAAKLGHGWPRHEILPWGAGVDLFFIISGFVMVISSQKLFGAKNGGAYFMARRALRIAPLYWIATLIALGGALYAARMGAGPQLDFSLIAASFAFIPWPNPMVDGAMRPVVGLGWTLEYEMFFYLIFAAFIFLPRRGAVAAVGGALALIVGFVQLFSPDNLQLRYWGDPIVFEFVAGMALALIYIAGQFRASGAVSLLLIAVGLVFLIADLGDFSSIPPAEAAPNGFTRLFSLGGPMAAIAAGCVLCARKPPDNRMTRGLAAIGDASYALYLFHPLAIIALRKTALALGMTSDAQLRLLICLDLGASVILAFAIYRLIERSMTNGLNKLAFAKKNHERR